MKTKAAAQEKASTLVVTIAVVATVLVLLAVTVDYTSHISRVAQRSRKSAVAVEIADGHLEMLFSSWRNVYRGTWTTASAYWGGDLAMLGGNYFFTSMYNPGPAPTPVPNMNPPAIPPTIPTPAPFSSDTYTLTQYRIQGVDPMINLDNNGNALKETSFGSETYTALSPSAVPPPSYGRSPYQYSFFYLASVDVKVPSSGGTVTAKVRRVFEKKFDYPWSFALFYANDLELHPTDPLTITGPIQTNGNLYASTSNLIATTSVGYAAEYVNGYSPNDTTHTITPTDPQFPSDMPPGQVSPYLPFGWVLNLTNADGSINNDSYHELIERPAAGADPIAAIRMYNQAAYRILIAENNNITITDVNGASLNPGSKANEYNAIIGALTTNDAIKDQREGTYVRLTTVDVGALKAAIDSNKLPAVNYTNAGGLPIGNVFYFADTTPNGNSVTAKIAGVTSVATTERAIRLTNGSQLPSAGLTVVAENPVYIQGNYNTGTNPPSNSGTYTDPDGGSYTRKQAAVMGDSINVLSNTWLDINSTSSISARAATNTTINAALVTGIVPTGNGEYSGGGENFIRLLEDWKLASFCYYGSMVQLWTSLQGKGPWTGAGNNYKAPMTSKYFWDPIFRNDSPPGRLQVAAYLQQQRWYQVY